MIEKNVYRERSVLLVRYSDSFVSFLSQTSNLVRSSLHLST